MGEQLEYKFITFLKDYSVKLEQLIDKENGLFRQTFYNKPKEYLTVEKDMNKKFIKKGILKRNRKVILEYEFDALKDANYTKVYNEKGEVIFIGYEKNNLKTGLCKEYVKGNLRFIGYYEYGMRNGIGCSFDQNGNKEFLGIWEDDEETNQECDENYFNSEKDINLDVTQALFPALSEFVLFSVALLIISLLFVVIFYQSSKPSEKKNVKLLTGYTWTGYTWTGLTKKSLPNGYGTVYYLNEYRYYEGNCWEGYFHGLGTMYYLNGMKKLKGEWSYNYLINGTIYSETGEKLYEGEFMSSIPHGVGRGYRNGTLYFEGIWKNGYDYRGVYYSNGKKVFEKRKQLLTTNVVATSLQDLEMCTYKTTTLIIPDHSFNQETDTLDLSRCNQIEKLYIGNNCGRYIQFVNITHFPRLQYINIARESFSNMEPVMSMIESDFTHSGLSASPNAVNRTKRFSRLFHISYAKSGLDAEDHLLDLPSLQNVVIGKKTPSRAADSISFSFVSVDSFVMENMPSLSSLTLGNGVASLSRTHAFRDLPALTVMSIGYNHFNIRTESTVEMKNLPMLRNLVLMENAFKECSMLTLQSIIFGILQFRSSFSQIL